MTFLKKLISRKFLLALIVVITGILSAVGLADNTIEYVASILTALIPAIIYVITEGKIDAAAVNKIDIDALFDKLKDTFSSSTTSSETIKIETTE